MATIHAENESRTLASQNDGAAGDFESSKNLRRRSLELNQQCESLNSSNALLCSAVAELQAIFKDRKLQNSSSPHPELYKLFVGGSLRRSRSDAAVLKARQLVKEAEALFDALNALKTQTAVKAFDNVLVDRSEGTEVLLGVSDKSVKQDELGDWAAQL